MTNNSNTNNKRIAKNTLILYFRMLLIMLVQLYTVRIVLNTLGVVDYGIFSVVGGIVVMFSFLSNTMASASQRFFAFDLGRNDITQLKKTFSVTVSIYIAIAFIVFILAETVGLWFLNSKMNIPVERMDAANWIYQFSIGGFLITILTIPYNAIIIARENMSIYAFLSVVEVILKLGVVYLLVLFSVDKLKLYSILLFSTTLIVSSSYLIYCRREYAESRYKVYWDTQLFKTLISYSGWNLYGAIAGVFNNQGINILLNLFFGPVVNTARGIAFNISTAISQFVMNFHTAVKPQITKYFAAGQNEKMMSLVFNSSKYSFFLLFVLSFPVLMETHYILVLWLKDVPEYVVLFTRLVIINALIDSLVYSMQTAVQATGKIKLYQIVVGGMMLLNLPVSYLFLKYGYPPQVTMYISIINSIICVFLRLMFLKNLINLSIYYYVYTVLLRVLIVAILVAVIPTVILFLMDESFFRLILQILSIFVTSLSTVFFIGLTSTERLNFKKLIVEKWHKKRK